MFYSLKNRLIAFFVILLVISFGTMFYLLFQESRSIIRSYIESSALEKMDEYGSFVQMALSQMYDLSSVVFNSDTTKKWDNALSDPLLPEGEKMLANLNMSQFLTQTTNNYSIASSVTIYRKDGSRIGDGNEVSVDHAFQDEEWYQSFAERGNHWDSAHADPIETRRARPYQVVSLMLPIGTFEPSLSKSVMKVNVSSDFFLEPLNRIHLGENGTIFLLDQDDRPILAQTEEFDRYPDLARNMTLARSAAEPKGVMYLENERGTTDILVYKKLQLNNWILVGLVPEQDLFVKLIKLRDFSMLVATLLLILAIVGATWISYGITKPLSRLASAMRHVQKGDFAAAESRIPKERNVIGSEVEFVTSTFRTMVRQLRQHIKVEFELKLLRQQAEYKALLMQINPHFLFNTLELMSSLAIQRRTEDTVTVITALGRMLRFSLRISDDLVPLAEELKYLRHYEAILRIRFGERLHLTIEEQGDTGQREIVKFILQPLVENAVKYSLQGSQAAQVKIQVANETGRVRLSVADNGPGMAEEQLERLQAETAAIPIDQILQSKSQQIGLRNVLARCQLYYGSSFTFAIRSAAGEGTVIELYLPTTEGGKLE
ncbi:sensor histidine kinase [Paenibacillus sp. H1-7]|uniref:sensor histidine kinase n=1 Tax=Paenibacillus sp. H1-7 TaxID=2282849 RepID=UPI001EF7AF8B|nr:sensor histidine kinase [Paenibacillus sp. H1-7]ULL14939.1 sensor histidine kinase [Paenibacillus sp. H1-7]